MIAARKSARTLRDRYLDVVLSSVAQLVAPTLEERAELRKQLGNVDAHAHRPDRCYVRSGIRRTVATLTRMAELDLKELLAAHADDALELHARTINPQYVRMLRTIGYDRAWARAEGAHLYDAEGTRYLDWLGGFGMYNVGRNNPRVRSALVEALQLETPGKLALGVIPLAGLLAEALLERAPSGLGRVLFTSSGAEAVEAAIKIGRAATGRTRVVSVERGFHGLTLGALSASGDAAFSERFEPFVPGFSRIPWDDLDALERELRAGDVALFVVEPIVGHGLFLPSPRLPRGRTGALSRARHALLRRRGADRARPHGPLPGPRALGSRARRRHDGEVAVRGLRARRGDAVPAGGVRCRLRLDGTLAEPRIDVPAERPGHGRRARDVARARRRRARRALGAARRAAARAHAPARRALRRRQGGPWARADVGDRARRARAFGKTAYRLLERMRPALFSQLVVVPLFRSTGS